MNHHVLRDAAKQLTLTAHALIRMHWYKTDSDNFSLLSSTLPYEPLLRPLLIALIHKVARVVMMMHNMLHNDRVIHQDSKTIASGPFSILSKSSQLREDVQRGHIRSHVVLKMKRHGNLNIARISKFLFASRFSRIQFTMNINSSSYKTPSMIPWILFAFDYCPLEILLKNELRRQ